jgi:GT2 family glycosyltransferase
MIKITIITNTIRRPLDLVSKSVESSLAQDSVIGVVLMDQNQSPLIFPAQIENHSKFKHLTAVVPSVSMARNLAPYPADSEWLIFCDDDGYLETGYVSKLLDLFRQHPQVEIYAGSIKRIDNGEYYSKRHAIGGDMKWFINTKLLMGSNFVIKRSVFEKLGKFDEMFGAGAPYGSSEETDLAWNAFFHGVKMRYSPELVVFHVPPFATDAKNEIKKAYRYGVGKAALVRKWLFLGKISVLLELGEMFVIPLLKSPMFLLMLKGKEALVQVSGLAGRFTGLFTVRKPTHD